MKIENLKRAQQLDGLLKTINKAIADVKATLDEVNVDVDGHAPSTTNGLYQFHFSQYRDGSGPIADLTGCMVGTAVLKFTLEQLKKQKGLVEDEIETL